MPPLRFTLLAITNMTLAACVSIPTTDVEAIITTPAAYDHASAVIATARQQDADWLSAFEVAPLNQLVAQAEAENLDIEAGIAILKSAEASLKSARSGLMPSATASVSSSAASQDDFSSLATTGRLSASYSLDLFKQTGFSILSAEESLLSQHLTQRALELTVKTDTASSYLTLTSLRDQYDTARTNLQISQRIFDLVQLRYDAGAVSGFDLESQRASLANSKARIPQLDQQITSAQTALALLLGQAPQGFEAPPSDIAEWVIPQMAPNVDLPSDLLTRRPDILAAEADLRSANANIAAAKAAFFPTIDLSAGVSTLLSSGTDLITSTAAALSAPIFTGGRLEAQKAGAIAQRDILISRYKQAVYNAYRDVDIALSSIQSSRMREAELSVAETSSAKALELAEIRYSSGAADLNSLLNAQTNYFSAKDSLMQARADRLQAAIDLYAALGGYW